MIVLGRRWQPESELTSLDRRDHGRAQLPGLGEYVPSDISASRIPSGSSRVIACSLVVLTGSLRTGQPGVLDKRDLVD